VCVCVCDRGRWRARVGGVHGRRAWKARIYPSARARARAGAMARLWRACVCVCTDDDVIDTYS